MATIGVTATDIPSSQRVVPGSVNIPVVDFQKIKFVRPDEIEQATEEWVNSFNKIIKSGSFSDLKNIFLQDSFWRDHLCLSWDHSKKIFHSRVTMCDEKDEIDVMYFRNFKGP